MTVTSTALEVAAVTLAERGYYVFPCRPGRKEPLTANGFKDATRDERQILHWWDRTPDANIGIACQASGIVVLDIDSKHGADPRQILTDHLEPGAPVIQTGVAPARDDSHPRSLEGVRGAQVYFRGSLRTGDLNLPGCELRGDGAYVVAPPSVHPSGVAYGPQLPGHVNGLPPVPEWVQGLIPHRENGTAQTAAPVGDTIIAGARNQHLASLAGTLRRRGMDADEIEATLAVINAKRCRPPLDADELRQIAQSIAKYEPSQALNGSAAIQRGDERFVVTTEVVKGKLTITLPPPADTDDLSGHCAWLTAVFSLDPRFPIIRGVRRGGRGADKHVVLERGNTKVAFRFEPASRINTPQKLVEDLTWQGLPTDNPVPAFNGGHCRQISDVIRRLCVMIEEITAEQESRGIIGSYQSRAVPVEGYSTYGDSRARYSAAAALQRDRDERGMEIGPMKYLIDANTGELVIPVEDLTKAAREFTGGSLPRGWLDSRLEDFGWRKATLDGHGVLGREGRRGPHLVRQVYRGHLVSMGSEEEAA